MTTPLDAPNPADLADFPVVSDEADEPWIKTLELPVGNGGTVRVAWDEVAASVSVRWSEGGQTRLEMEREGATRVALAREGEYVIFEAWFSRGDLGGRLAVRIGESVQVRDELLLS